MSPGDSADTIAAYTSACAFFGERLATVTDLDWERPTPCEGWDVRTLVAHVVTGEALVAQVLGGGGSWDADVDPSVLGLNPMAAWRGTALAALDAASGDGVLDAIHPRSGRPARWGDRRLPGHRQPGPRLGPRQGLWCRRGTARRAGRPLPRLLAAAGRIGRHACPLRRSGDAARRGISRGTAPVFLGRTP